MTETLLPTTVVGSYPQPDWLIDRDKLTHLPPVRVRAEELWRVPEPWLEAAQDDATLIAIRDMERAGIDIITDGEIRRESYSNRFATALDGMDLDNPGTALDRTGHPNPVPRVVGPIRRIRPVEMRDVQLLRANSDRPIKAINRALEGITGTTALHTCFGYAHIVHDRPKGYPFLEPLADTTAQQISIESAQQNVDLGVLDSLRGKTLIVGVIDLADNSAV